MIGFRYQVVDPFFITDFKIIVEKHTDGYVAYPFGLKGVVVGQGNTYEEALADVKSAIAFHIETFGEEAFENDAQSLSDQGFNPADNTYSSWYSQR